MLDIEKIKELILIMSRVYLMTHEVVIMLAIILMFGGLYAMFSQSKRGFGMLGIDPHKHGAGLGVSMFFAGAVLSVLDGFIAIFTIQFAQVTSPLETLSAEGAAAVVAGGGDNYYVLFMRLLGMYAVYIGYFFCIRGLYHAAGAGSNQMSGAKILFFSFLGGLGAILIGRYLSGFGVT